MQIKLKTNRNGVTERHVKNLLYSKILEEKKDFNNPDSRLEFSMHDTLTLITHSYISTVTMPLQSAHIKSPDKIQHNHLDKVGMQHT